jgi:cysteine synthase
MTFLTYTSDLILGAIAGVVVLGVGGLDTSDRIKLIATCIVAGLGGSGFLTNLGTKLQAEADKVTFREKLDQATSLLNQTQNMAAAGHEQVQDSLVGQGTVPEEIANQVSDNFAQIQAVAESRPEVPPTP